MRSFVRSTVAAALLSGLAWLLVTGPNDGAAGPDQLSASAIDDWYQQAGPAVVVIAAIRGVAIVLTGWLLLLALLQVVTSLPLLRLARPVVDVVTPRAMQRLLHGVAGASLAAAVALPGPVVALDAEPPPDVAVMHVIDAEPPPPTPAPPALPPVAPPATADDAPSPGAAPLAVTPTAIVQRGDSFWSIAEAYLQHLGASPTDREVVRYWERLVAVNVGRLADPANPDLLYAGQVLELPPV